mmetsp:Transcript_79573/g.230102  ORF Transcript_79573/g.230102 Transcript_79573/m.230102 type:complete len:350 (-) Transcript_79573:404-1453(-)
MVTVPPTSPLSPSSSWNDKVVGRPFGKTASFKIIDPGVAYSPNSFLEKTKRWVAPSGTGVREGIRITVSAPMAAAMPSFWPVPSGCSSFERSSLPKYTTYSSMSKSFLALVILTSPPSSPASMSASLKDKLALSVGTPVQTPSSIFGMVLPGHCAQASSFLHVSVARQYSFSDMPHVIGELETVVMPLRVESSFSCISIQMCMLPIFVFLSAINLGHFLGHLLRRVTLSLPTDAALQLEVSLEMWSNKPKDKKYLYLLFECFPRPEKLNMFLVMFTEGSVTSKAPGAFHRTVYLIVRNMQVSFCAHWKAGATCCAKLYFGLSVLNNSSASSFKVRTAFRTAKERSTCCS